MADIEAFYFIYGFCCKNLARATRQFCNQEKLLFLDIASSFEMNYQLSSI